MKNLLVICDIPDANLFFTSVNSDTLPLLYSKDALLQVMADNTFERIGIAFEKKEIFDVDFRLFNVKHIDFLACDTLNDPMWRNYYKMLQDAGITVGASDNKTGNLKYGGDWVMESTSEDIEKVYFSTGIEYYKYLLGSTSEFMFVMKSDGLYGSGDNTYQQLGSKDSRGFTGALAVSCGENHTVAIKDGILYGCGSNQYGQLGIAVLIGGQTDTLTPISDLTGFTTLSCGGYYTIAIKDEILYGCGRNNKGQLGSAAPIGGETGTLTPISGLTGFKVLSCGYDYIVAIKDGILYGCGYGVDGQLGSAGTTGTLTPISGETGFMTISCGYYHTVAIKDGILYGCGDNLYGQLGSAGSTGTLTPMSGLTGFTAVSCGYENTVAIKDGFLYGCGSNDNGQLGNSGGNLYAVTKLIVPTVETLIAVSCGYNYTLVLTSTGILYGAGSNTSRLLGDTGIHQYNRFIEIDTNVLNINDSGKVTTYLQFTQGYINKQTTLSASSNSPSVITFSSSSNIISVTGSIVKPKTRGIATINAYQGATGNFLETTVTESVQIYYNNLGFTGLPLIINKETKLSVTSDSTGAISYTSNSILSFTGSGNSCIVTPLQTGTGTIVATQLENGNYFSRTVTGSVEVYYNNLGFTHLPSMINKKTTLSVTSDSPGSISYHSTNPHILSVTGTGTSCTVTPLQTGATSIIVTQEEFGKYSSATVTGPVYVINNSGSTGSIQSTYNTIDLSNYFSDLTTYNIATLDSNYICILHENYIIIYNIKNNVYKKVKYSYLNVNKIDIKDILFTNNKLYIATNNNIYNFDISSYPLVSNIISLT